MEHIINLKRCHATCCRAFIRKTMANVLVLELTQALINDRMPNRMPINKVLFLTGSSIYFNMIMLINYIVI